MVTRPKISGDDRFLTQETGAFSPKVAYNLFFPEYIFYRNKPLMWPYGEPNFIPSEYKVVTMDELVGWNVNIEKITTKEFRRYAEEEKKDLRPAQIGGNTKWGDYYRELYMGMFRENFKKAFVGRGEERSVYICKKGIEIHRVVVGENDDLRVLAGKKKIWKRGVGRVEGSHPDNNIVLGVNLSAPVFVSKRKMKDIPTTYKYRDRDGNIKIHNYIKRGRTLDGVWFKAKPDKPSAWERGDSKWQKKRADREGVEIETWFQKEWGFDGRQFMKLPISNKRTRDNYLFLVHKHGFDRLGIFNWIDL